MAREAKAKIFKVKSRHTIYLRTDLVNDSTFPFKIGEPLTIRIENGKLVIEKEEK